MLERIKNIRHIYLAFGFKESFIITLQKSKSKLLAHLLSDKAAHKYVVFRELGAMGRLGNQFFQIAATLGIAQKNGAEARFCYWPFAKYLNIPSYFFHLPNVKTTLIGDEEKGYKNIKLNGHTELFGFYQTEKYFKEIEATVREYFTLKGDYAKELKAYIQSFNKTVVSLHVRRGDFLKWKLQLLDMAYYEKAISYFPADCIFLIFSDDINWCKTQFKGERFVFKEKDNRSFSTGLSDLLDMYLMSFCHHHITANSTFSWWGAWLNERKNKTVVCHKHWLDKTEGYNKDVVPESWISIS